MHLRFLQRLILELQADSPGYLLLSMSLRVCDITQIVAETIVSTENDASNENLSSSHVCYSVTISILNLYLKTAVHNVLQNKIK